MLYRKKDYLKVLFCLLVVFYSYGLWCAHSYVIAPTISLLLVHSIGCSWQLATCVFDFAVK